MTLPDWATARCDWCGDHMPYSSIYHTVDNKQLHTHGLTLSDCTTHQQRIRETLPVEYMLLKQKVIECTVRMGSFLCGSGDDEWNDVGRCQDLLLTVDEWLEQGLRGLREYEE